MAIDWGSYEGPSGGLQIRVGIEVDWEPVTHGEAAVTATVKYYTQNHFSWSDDQSLNLGGAIDGSINFHNGQGEAVTQRGGARTHTYSYGANEYGSSPGTRTFSASLSGAFNGITPSKSVTKGIPARPIAGPNPPTQVSASRVNDSTIKVTWNRNPTSGRPWDRIIIERDSTTVSWTQIANIDGSANSYTDSEVRDNRRYTYRVRARNSAGDSSNDSSGDVWTSPATPSSPTRTPSGANQLVGWTNTTAYNDFSTQVWHAADGVWDASPLTTMGGSPGTTQSYTHTAPSSSQQHKYRMRAVTSLGPNIYSAYSAETSETSGTTTPPSAPTNLAPTGGQVVDPTTLVVLTWTHNGTPDQTKYEVQHRKVGIGSWTSSGQITDTVSSYTLSPSHGYTYGESIEWQVRTWGNDPNPSAYSATATFVMRAATAEKYPVYLDLVSGQLEALSAYTPGEEGAAVPAHNHRFRHSSSNHVFATGVAETLKFDTNESNAGDQITYNDTDGKFTFLVDGVFDISAGLSWSNNPDGRRALTVQHSALGQIDADSRPPTSGTASTTNEISFTFSMQAGQTIHFNAIQASGGNLGTATGRDGYWARITRIDAEQGATGLTGPPGVGMTDGNKGDLTVSGSGASWQLNAGVVGTTELADGSVTSSKIGFDAIYNNHLSLETEIFIDAHRPDVEDEGTLVNDNVHTIDFTGTGVTVTAAGDDVTVAIPGTAGAAGGDLSGTYPNPTIGTGKVTSTHIADGTIVHGDVATANRDGAAATPSMRTLGTGAAQAAAGDHTHAGLAPALTIKDETTVRTTTPSELAFTGVGVTATGGPAVTIDVPGVPVGSIMMWPTATPPARWLICNGQSTSGYTALAAVVGANVPDLTGKFPLGVGTTQPSGTAVALGGAGGADQRTLATGNLPPHAHDMEHAHNWNGRPAASAGSQNNVFITASGTTTVTPPTTWDSTVDATGNGPGTSTPLPTLPPYLALNFIIYAGP